MNSRNEQILKRFDGHSLKQSLERALEASERFIAAAHRIAQNPNLSVQGRSAEVQAQARSALRDLRDMRAPIDSMRARRAQLAEGVKQLAFDKADIVGAMNRAERRSVVASRPMVERMKLLLDPEFRDAILEQPPLVSGIAEAGELGLYAKAKQSQLDDLHAPRLREIEALDHELEGADAVLAIARDDLKRELGFADDRAFEAFAAPIETRLKAPWLKKDKGPDGAERIIRIMAAEPDFDGRADEARLATPDEIRDGKFYASLDEYRADRAA